MDGVFREQWGREAGASPSPQEKREEISESHLKNVVCVCPLEFGGTRGVKPDTCLIVTKQMMHCHGHCVAKEERMVGLHYE